MSLRKNLLPPLLRLVLKLKKIVLESEKLMLFMYECHEKRTRTNMQNILTLTVNFTSCSRQEM